MSHVTRFGIALLAVLACLVPVRAAESRIPLYAATTITTPGSYVVTRDIAAATAIVVNNVEVRIDLNGHTLTGTDPNATVITVTGGGSATVVNGIVNGGGNAILVDSTAPNQRLFVSDVVFENQALTAIRIMEANSLTIQNVTIRAAAGGGITLGPSKYVTMVRITGNDIHTAGRAIELDGARVAPGGDVSSNVVRSDSSDGLYLTAGVGGLDVIHNTIVAGAVGLYVGGIGGNRIESNAIRNGLSYGMRITCDNNRVYGNAITASTLDGLHVSSAGNLIDSNLSNANLGWGLYFEPSASQNIYRNNVVRGDAAGAITAGIANVDGGGNL